MSSSSKNPSNAASLDYFGSIAGTLCCGPLDFISGVLVDQALIWPIAPVWPASAAYVHSKVIWSDGVHVGIQTDQPHGLSVGDQVTTWNFDDASPLLNVVLATVTSVNDAYGFRFAAPAGLGSIPSIQFDEGFVSKANAYSIGDLARVGATVYQCAAAHASSLATQPPNAAYWTQFRLDRPDSSDTILVEAGATDADIADSHNIYKLTTESHGELFIYWGGANQTLNTTHENVLAPLGHPAYRNQVLIVLKDWFFGTGTGNVPNILIIGGRSPDQSVITGDSADLDADGQANPLCCIAELLTHPIWGLGLDPSLLDPTTWQSTADWLYGDSGANAAVTYISPLLDQAANIRSIISDLLDGCDCWLRWNSAGLIEAGHWPHNQAPPEFIAGQNIINYHNAILGEELGWKSKLWDDTFNKITVHYADRDHAWKTRPAIASAQWNRTASGRIQERQIDRPQITRRAQALAVAAYEAKISSQPGVAGAVTIRAETVTAQPGDLVQLTEDAAGATLFMRVTERTLKAPPAGRAEYMLTSERGLSPAPYMPTPTGNLQGQLPLPGILLSSQIEADGTVVAAPNFALVQLPPVVSGGQSFELTLLAGRTSAVTSAMAVWYLAAGGDTYTQLATIQHFAVAGIVTTAFAPFAGGESDDDSLSLQFEINLFTPDADTEHILVAPGADQINDNDLVIVVVKNGAPTQLEVMTLKAITAVGDSVYNATVRRGTWATLQGGDGVSSWEPDDLVFVIWAAELTPFGAPTFESLAFTGGTANFRLSPGSKWFQDDVSDVYDAATNPAGLTVQTSYTFADPYAPTLSGWSLTVNGAAFDPSSTYLATDIFVLQVTAASPIASLTGVQIQALGGSGSPVSISITTAVAGLASVLITSAPFTLGQGDWHIAGAVQDSAGRSTMTGYQSGGADVLVHVPATGAAPNAPTASPGSSYGEQTVTLSCSTAGATIQYQITSGSTPPASGSWLTYSAPVDVGEGSTLWARAYTAGPTYSGTAYWTYRVPPRGPGFGPP